MNVYIDKSFEKDLAKTHLKTLRKKVAAIIEKAITLQNVEDLPHLKKIQGYQNYYRIRVGDYRIGIECVEMDIYFLRCLHRKDIYKYFP